MAEEAGRKRDKEELASAQAAECQELIETVTKAAALEDVGSLDRLASTSRDSRATSRHGADHLAIETTKAGAHIHPQP